MVSAAVLMSHELSQANHPMPGMAAPPALGSDCALTPLRVDPPSHISAGTQ